MIELATWLWQMINKQDNIPCFIFLLVRTLQLLVKGVM